VEAWRRSEISEIRSQRFSRTAFDLVRRGFLPAPRGRASGDVGRKSLPLKSPTQSLVSRHE
jgi:hypothetical protein